MPWSAIEVERNGPVALVWLARPEVHNTFDAVLVEELTEAFVALGNELDVRAIVLSGRGKSFSAGAQAQWMKQQGAAPLEENVEDAKRLANLFHVIAESPKPTIARVQGAAIGGGVGLVCACDIAIGADTAVFATSEVRLGLIPATIAPYVVRAVGERHARRLFLTGERMNASTAKNAGLLHEAVPAGELDQQIQTVLGAVLAGAPSAQREAKQLVNSVKHRPITAELMDETAEWIARRRADAEAVEGLNAFLDKRPAKWVPTR